MTYIIQTIAFQLLFLIIYDFFLKKETFFNWNRAYLLLTPLLSVILPFVELESFKTTVPQNYMFLLPEIVLTAKDNSVNVVEASLIPTLSILEWIFIIGSVISLLWFLYKLLQIQHLKKEGKTRYFEGYNRIEVAKEDAAFSFFKDIFIGKSLLQKEHKHIIEHELVHIKEKHSLDLIFFEILRIVFWFNPLIYIYQARITELHEFIADAKTVKNNKKEHYQLLLEEVFKTDRISFINHFFNQSLIKKRIVMLQKSKSKKVWQLKYLVLIPMVLSMLFYTSCEKEESIITEKQMSIEEQVRELEAALESSDEELSPELRKQIFSLAVKTSNKKYNTDKKFDASKIDQGEDIPFTVIPVKPMFKDCEGLAQELQFECFKEKIDNHVRATFKYPLEAQNNGIQGRVYINFRINIDGSVTILNSRAPAASLDLEARRIIEALPTFLPGKDQNGNLHPVTFAYPIVFKLS
ncbi:M56 family metallopeptidase [Galbibacter orientalis]|uniref:M56 family metallopeptidase n=1 Tax=Galbibacter orientalis TaxID=453852 RepID=UPI0030018F15